MKIRFSKLLNDNGTHCGYILITDLTLIKPFEDKRELEDILANYAPEKLFCDSSKGYHYFSEINNDTASIIVLKSINSLVFEEVDIP